ncbi:chitobiase/beta-hexosaminidase C-terminal domain-containing protein [Lacibacter sediminis]|uniref:Chitobiase/beta-hexosaminidase C-terminal domain-containing protein n=1 Tax=Lacibacter sediminis TaxID=2760713 RepID=A0A7G5XB50_9BACT|nr:chitobiase/beta-hexosaminidase C-terminal domain-containing protein [Lacibacter sediminis]QNA42703.1 chitobiase/beta-hexosaminidase C-terminal domain-containing protein [Lacibacter sediminis]
MKRLVFLFLLAITQYSFAQQLFQLAPPVLNYRSVFFQDETTLEIKFEQPGAEIRYTINGDEPTPKDLLYTKPIVIAGKRVSIKAKAIGKDFLPSETVYVEFIKTGKVIQQISFTTPHPKYTTNNKNLLNDHIGGNTSFSSGAWLGYDCDTVEIDIELKKNETINGVLVDILQNESSWIFLPEQVILYYYDEAKKSYLPLGKETFSSERPSQKQIDAREIIPKITVKANKLKLILYPLKKIPAWHPGKDNHAWLFIDEIQVY